MNIFESVKAVVTARQAAAHYGIECNRNGMARCPFHNDRTPSMKLDTRFHCFGCQADGDVIDFTARLFGLGKYEAAQKLAADFSVSGSYHDPPGKLTPIRAAYDQKSWILHAADVLIAYEKLLKGWRKQYAPSDRESELHPLYVESLRQLDRIELLVDMALGQDETERHALYLNYKDEVQIIEKRIADHRRNEGKPYGGECQGNAPADEKGYGPAMQTKLCDRAGERSAS